MIKTEIPETLDDTVTLLMMDFGNGHPTLEQAEETTLLFSNNTEKAVQLAKGYFSLEPEERKKLYGSYTNLLETIRTAILGPTTVPTLYEVEVTERTSIVPRSALTRASYRDRPQRSSHYWEHLAS